MCRKREHGGAIVETAVVLPILVIMLTGVVDLGRWFNDYMTVNRLAYEAARYGASIPGLEECTGAAIDGNAVLCNEVKDNHKRLNTRISLLLDLKDSHRFSEACLQKDEGSADPEAVKVGCIWTAPTMDHSSGAVGKRRSSTVTVRITVPFEASFLKFLNKVTSQVQAPYLYRDV